MCLFGTIWCENNQRVLEDVHLLDYFAKVLFFAFLLNYVFFD